ncbi:MAG: ABC transporter permease [Clostridia bacterium]|nr:ABC transporter permease [Clostridia bacterium]
MFLRMIKGTFIRQWKKMVMIAVTIALGASIATAMLNVMLDVGDKINEELKAYGANITVMSKSAAVLSDLYETDGDITSDAYLEENVIGELLTIFWANNIRDFAPFTDGTAKLNGKNVKVVGSWFNHHLAYPKKGTTYIRDTGLVNLRSWWEIKSGAWINEQGEKSDEYGFAMAGANVAQERNLKVGDEIVLSGKTNEKVRIVGVYESGDEEDDLIYTTLDVAQRLTGTENLVKSISVSAITSPDDELAQKAAKNPKALSMDEYDLWYCTAYVSSICYQIQENIPTSSASAIRQIADSEGDILEKTELLMSLITALSLIGAALGISNLVTSSVMERSGELGLLKAIGAKNHQITLLVLAEILVTAVVGAVVGYFMGYGFAQIIGHTVFGSAIEMKGIVAFIVAVLILAVTILGSLPAIRMILRLRPSEVLHGR